MVIKRFTSILGSRRFGSTSIAVPDGDSPEANAGRGVRLFCESGGPNNAEEEVLHLPVIVEATESSPQAATIAAQQIRKFLSKDNYSRPYVQYNAIMLIRILADNPGPTFTRNIDTKFTNTIKELLKNGRDQSVQQILRETLQALYFEKAYDSNLSNLFQMWSKESGGVPNLPPNAAWMNLPQPHQRQQQARSNRRAPAPVGLPPPAELASRIEEAKTSAKLLQQLVQSTAPSELQSNDLVKEFAERCQTAQRSMQGYISCDNPPPDDDTMQTLIEASEQLSLAASKHQRALLQARRATAAQPTTPSPRDESTNGTPKPQSAVLTLSQSAAPLRPNSGQDQPVAQTSATFVPAGPPPQPLQSNQTTTPYSFPPNTPSSLLRDRLERQAATQPIPPKPQPQPNHSRERSHSSANSLYSDQHFGPPPPSTADGYDAYRAEANAVDAPIPALPGRGAAAIPVSLRPATGSRDRPLPEFLPAATGANAPLAGPAVELPTPDYGNPFSDANQREEWEEDDDDDDEDATDTLYRPPGGGPMIMTSRVQAALSAVQAGNGGSPPSRPAPKPDESWKGQEGSYYPGYKSTPSYTASQDAAAEELAIGDRRESREGRPVSPNTQRGSVAGVSELSEGGKGSVDGVSPITERYSGRYRS